MHGKQWNDSSNCLLYLHCISSCQQSKTHYSTNVRIRFFLLIRLAYIVFVVNQIFVRNESTGERVSTLNISSSIKAPSPPVLLQFELRDITRKLISDSSVVLSLSILFLFLADLWLFVSFLLAHNISIHLNL